MKLLPATRALFVLCALAVLCFGVGVFSYFNRTSMGELLLPLSVLTAVIFLVDAVLAWRVSGSYPLSAERQMPHHFIVSVPGKVTLKLQNKGFSNLTVQVFDHLPESFVLLEGKTSAMPVNLTIGGGESAEITYRLKPQKRGAASFGGVQVRIASPLKLWQYNRFLAVSEAVKTYPDFRQIDQDDLLSDNMQSHGNLIHQRKRGTGTDFAQLREYRVGDALSQLDYKATARMNKLIAKEFQIERDQQVMILLDCSRRLRVFQSELSHFDYALNTAIFLARSVLKQGDAVGMMSFGSGETRYTPPKKGRNSVNRLLNQVYDLESSRDAPDYIRAAEQLMARQKRRSLIIVVTSLQEEDVDAVKIMLRILQKRHVVVIANLKEALLGENVTIKDLDDAVFYAARETYHRYRDKMLQQISNKKLILLDTYPQSLTAKLINLYLNIKQSGVF